MNKNEQCPNKSGEKPAEKKYQVFEGFADYNATEKENLMLDLAISFRKRDYGYGKFTERELDDFISSKIAETSPAKREEMEKLLAEIKDEILTNDGYLATEKPFSGFIKE
jgi:hypothetical protein